MMDAHTLAVGAEAPYWQGLNDGRLVLPRCKGCGRWHWPAVFHCPACGSWEMAWEDVEPRGAIYSWTRNWHRFGGLEALDIPFITATVALPQAGGIRLMGLVEPGDAEIAIGMAVAGQFSTTRCFGSDIPAIHWRIAGGGA